MTYAVLDISGRQIIVEPGKFYDINYLSAEPGDVVHFNRVLFAHKNDNYAVGKPCLDAAYAKGTILKHLSGDKITVFKFKRKKNSRFKKGHRQKLTRVFIEDIML